MVRRLLEHVPLECNLGACARWYIRDTVVEGGAAGEEEGENDSIEG